MANTIITKNSITASAVPTSGQLVQGELAVNVTDKRLFTENNGGVVVEVGTNPSTIAVVGNATVGGTLGVTGTSTLAAVTATTVTASGGLAVTSPATGLALNVIGRSSDGLSLVILKAANGTTQNAKLTGVATGLKISAAGVEDVVLVTSTGLAVTGAISATTSFTLLTSGFTSKTIYGVGNDITINSPNGVGTVSLRAAGNDRGVFSSTGLAVTGAISATEIISANKGITFPATQVASAAANTLDDYEEGLFTPSIAGTATAGTYELSLSEGKYTKIGNAITITCRIKAAATVTGGGTGSLKVVNAMPFTYNGNLAQPPCFVQLIAFTGSYVVIAKASSGTSSSLIPAGMSNTGVLTFAPIASFVANAVIEYSFTYYL